MMNKMNEKKKNINKNMVEAVAYEGDSIYAC